MYIEDSMLGDLTMDHDLAARHFTLHVTWGARQDPIRLWPLGVSGCLGAARRLRVLWGVTLGSNGQPRVVPGLHASGEDGDRWKVVLP